MSDRNNSGVILIVDDEIEIVEILAKMLKPLGCGIEKAHNGADALKLVLSGAVDSVLSDINMPVMSGLQMLAEIRNMKFLTPVVILSAFGDRENIREALRLDATDFLDKPFLREEVVNAARLSLDLGMAIKKMEKEIDIIFHQKNLPADDITYLKMIKKRTEAMKITHSIYVKKTW